MEVLVNKAGQRVFINSPRPDQADRNLILYDPNGYSNSNLGLYDRTRPPCQRWVDQFHQFQKKHPVPPIYSVDGDGRTKYYSITDDRNFMTYYR
jgi:hypothetical protein